MADRGRDLKVSILSGTERFDLTRPADQLDKLGDAAAATDRQLDKLDTTHPRQEIDRLGDEARQTASRVDSAFDAIAASSRRSATHVGDSSKAAATSMRDVADEAKDTAREAAASFSGGMDDIGDAVQEMAANALGKLGPLGAAAGMAAAAGIGLLTSGLQAAADEANALTERTITLAQAIRAAGGSLKGETLTDTLREWADQIVDTKSWFEIWQDRAVTNLDKVRSAAKGVGTDVTTMFGAMSGMDATRAATVLAQIGRLTDQINARQDIGEAEKWEKVRALEAVRDEVTKNLAVYRDAEERERLLASLTDDGTKKLTDRSDALAEAAAAQEAFYADTSSIDKWAAATTDGHELAKISVRDYLRELEDEVAAQSAWATNMASLSKRGVEQGVLAELARLGPEAAPLVAKLTTATDAELTRLQGAMATRGRLAADQLVSSITGAAPAVSLAARSIVSAAVADAQRQAAMQPIVLQVDANTAAARAKLAQFRADAKAAVMERLTP